MKNIFELKEITQEMMLSLNHNHTHRVGVNIIQ